LTSKVQIYNSAVENTAEAWGLEELLQEPVDAVVGDIKADGM
jgi:hypothetical protein